MNPITRYPETMTGKERVKRSFDRLRTDRVTVGYEANPGIHQRLAEALGIPDGDMEQVRLALGVDYRGIAAPYVGPALFTAPPERRVDPLEGCVMRWVGHEGGGYWDFCDFPLGDAEDIEAYERFPVPDPDDFDYEAALARARAYGDAFGLYVGHPGIPDVINANGRVMGMETLLIALVTGDEGPMRFIERRVAYQLAYLERLLDAGRGLIDFVWLGEDLGTQIGPMISLATYREVLRPIHQRFIDLAASHKLPVMVHSCGSSSWVYEDFIEMGVSAVDTLQPEAAQMSPDYLVEHFGGRLGFRGACRRRGR